MSYLNLPFIFLKFWFFENPRGLVSFLGSLNRSFLQMVSLPLLLRTFFKPWKNEYRKGFIGIAIGISIFIKTFVILADLFMLGVLLLVEAVIFVFIIIWPVLATVLIFKR